MKVIVAHNSYQTPGGEDAVFRSECQLLKDFGNEVETFEKNNSEIEQLPFSSRLKSLVNVSWSKTSYQELRSKIQQFKPDVVHVHNVYYLLTPSIYYACKDENVPVVQSQHNFRLQCSNGLLFRNNKVCELCIEKSMWQGVIHKCFQGSHIKTALLAKSIADHWKKGTWKNVINAYILASEFGKKILINAGIDEDKVFVKPQLLYPEVESGDDKKRMYALYIGRLSEEKGIDVLLKAWADIPDVPLKIIGKGPLLNEIKKKSENLKNIEVCGFLSNEKCEEYMHKAKFIIVPSLCYENFPRIVAESYAYGVPVLASRRGSLQEIIEDQKTGLLFEAGNAQDLAEKVNKIKGENEKLKMMSENAKRQYRQLYSAKRNYERLKFIYEKAIESYRK